MAKNLASEYVDFLVWLADQKGGVTKRVVVDGIERAFTCLRN